MLIVVILYAYWRKGKNNPLISYKRGGYQQTRDAEEGNSMRDRSRQPPPNFDAAIAEVNRNNGAGVDRNTSVRSVMTLPAYRTKADENEQVLGRAGDRDGVDTVVELPTAEDEEAMREDEMQTMYEIRIARRAEIAEREERRRLRREARARGDMVALAELSERARAASAASTVSNLRIEHSRIKEQRQRAVSSVSYAGVGEARHDGTRIRASSIHSTGAESENMGLLSDAASIAVSTNSQGTRHQRGRSVSSVLSFESNQDMPSPTIPRSGAATPRRLSAQHSGGTRAGSSPELIGEADLGEAGMPNPPDYDEVSLNDVRSGATTPSFNEPPPDYSGPSPTSERDRELSERVAGMVDSVGDDGDLGGRRPNPSANRSSRGAIPQLPSLRIRDLPQIVVEPSSAHPRDN